MEAAFCLGYGPLPSISLRMPSSIITATAFTKLHFGFNHSFISVSSGIIHSRRCHHLNSSGPLALDRPNSMTSGNEKGGGKVVQGAVGPSLGLACALSIIGCSCNTNFKAIAGPKQQVYQKNPSFQQFTPPAPGKVALKSLLDVSVNLVSKEGRKGRDVILVPPSPASRQLPPSKDQIDQLKDAVSLMKHGQHDEALYMLKNEYKKYEMSEPESAYYMNMVLVEVLIGQGKYDEAFEFTSDLDRKFSDFDVRPTLYKVG